MTAPTSLQEAVARAVCFGWGQCAGRCRERSHGCTALAEVLMHETSWQAAAARAAIRATLEGIMEPDADMCGIGYRASMIEDADDPPYWEDWQAMISHILEELEK